MSLWYGNPWLSWFVCFYFSFFQVWDFHFRFANLYIIDHISNIQSVLKRKNVYAIDYTDCFVFIIKYTVCLKISFCLVTKNCSRSVLVYQQVIRDYQSDVVVDETNIERFRWNDAIFAATLDVCHRYTNWAKAMRHFWVLLLGAIDCSAVLAEHFKKQRILTCRTPVRPSCTPLWESHYNIYKIVRWEPGTRAFNLYSTRFASLTFWVQVFKNLATRDTIISDDYTE